MKQLNRMCEMCNDNYFRRCPTCQGEGYVMHSSVTRDFNTDELEKLKQKIMELEKANSEPVYPSWEEGWKQIFPDALYTPCPANYGKKYKNTSCASVSCERCRKRPIPAEIAEKLGIKPVVREGKP